MIDDVDLPQPFVMRQRKHLPSVTEILGAAGLGVELNISDTKLAYVLRRGTALHSAIELDLAGDLDESSVHDDIRARLDAFRKFAAAVALRPIATEIELSHPTWKFMGHPDLVGYVNDRVALIDWKSSVDPHAAHAARLQIAAYDELWRVTYLEQSIEDHLIIELRADGTFRVHPIDLGDGRQVFLAAVVCWYARKEREKA